MPTGITTGGVLGCYNPAGAGGKCAGTWPVAAAGFVKGWLESRDIQVRDHDHNGLPVLVAETGARDADAPCVVLHGHLDVVPGRPEQFEPRIEGDRLIGRGAYDMKGGLAAMMCSLKDAQTQDKVKVRLGRAMTFPRSPFVTTPAALAISTWAPGGTVTCTSRSTRPRTRPDSTATRTPSEVRIAVRAASTPE